VPVLVLYCICTNEMQIYDSNFSLRKYAEDMGDSEFEKR